jgi:MFS family permease
MRRYFQFFLVVLAAGAIYPLMYLRTNYQETLLTVFNITLPQLNMINFFLGILWAVSYFPSGIICDKISAKALISVSLFGMVAGGIWYALIPSYDKVIIIFLIWGFFAVFTFWGSHMKLVKLLAKKEEEGRFFGILDGGRGVVEAALASVAVVIFAGVLGKSEAVEDKRSAIVSVIYMYTIVIFVIGVLVTIFVKGDAEKIKKEDSAAPAAEAPAKEKFQFKDLGMALKNKFIWLLGGIIFMSYLTYWTVYYYGGFLETNIKVNAVTVGLVTTVVLWMRPIGGVLGGFMADKVGKTFSLRSSLAGGLVCLLAMSVLPPSTGKPVFYALAVLAGISVYAIRGTYWSLMGECKIEDKLIGVTIGIGSAVGYLPDIVLPLFINFLFKTFGPNGGYNAYFISSAAVALVGVGLVTVFGKLSKKAA